MGCAAKKTKQPAPTTSTNVTNSSCKDAIATYLKQTTASSNGEMVAK
ncbi:MAG: hypothetical protein WCL18_05655 [bacterium]